MRFLILTLVLMSSSACTVHTTSMNMDDKSMSIINACSAGYPVKDMDAQKYATYADCVQKLSH